MELIVEVRDAEEGGFYARALEHSIFTEADTWEGLRVNVLEVTWLHFDEDSVRPRLVQLHYVKDERVPAEGCSEFHFFRSQKTEQFSISTRCR